MNEELTQVDHTKPHAARITPGRATISLKEVLFNIGLAILSIMLALGAAEVYFRLFDPQPIVPRYVETSPYGIRKNIGNVRGEMIVPEYRHQFSTNSQGFRGTREYSIKKPAHVFRIIVLGDSVALGHGVGDDETFSSVLEARLSRQRPAEVINMAVSGFGTAEELIQLQQVGLQYDPDLVILAYFPNDPYNNAVSQLFRVTDGRLVRTEHAFVPAIYVRDRLYQLPGYSFLCQHSHVVNFIRDRLSMYFTRRLGEQQDIQSESSTTLTREQTELTSRLLRAVSDETTRREIPLIVLNIPLYGKTELTQNMPPGALPDSSLIDNVDVAENIYEGHSVEEIQYKKDGHPKPFAHALIADWLAAFVRDTPSLQSRL
ncbi:hypothetical protein W02_42670 [Nitrospira sp. KM1]|uniref:SGNH/GDSL hydrolase family protein n=1 Tax=Nitrospira sp. KM1 TaxID=1936990 RepID=UPI0013A71CD7|nr:GDSL-type esterase/lipase family protein [Nitrospira sp. KM1]BCA57127.1 hypothetical protein W02_42670 [Nitrospira sp. KM1]